MAELNFTYIIKPELIRVLYPDPELFHKSFPFIKNGRLYLSKAKLHLKECQAAEEERRPPKEGSWTASYVKLGNHRLFDQVEKDYPNLKKIFSAVYQFRLALDLDIPFQVKKEAFLEYKNWYELRTKNLAGP